MRKDEILELVATWIKLEDIRLSKVSLKVKHAFIHKWNVEKQSKALDNLHHKQANPKT